MRVRACVGREWWRPVPQRSGRELAGLVVAVALLWGAPAWARRGELAPTARPERTSVSDLPTGDPRSGVPVGSLVRVVEQIGATRVRNAGITGRGVHVAVIDTGAAPVPALAGPGKVVAMVDLSSEAGIPEARFLDTYGHGTHMTGIIGGHGADGFAGVAPGAGIVSVKVGDNTGAVDVSQVIAGLEWVGEHAAELGIRVVNLSYGTSSVQSYLVDPLAYAAEEAWRAGLVVVVAVGNDGKGVRRLANPAFDPFVIAVAAVEAADLGPFRMPNWSTSGDGFRDPDVSAPGTHVISLRAPGSRIDVEHPEGYVSETLFKGSGSSQAAAVVSGAVALLLEQRPELTPDDVKALLRSTAVLLPGLPERFQGRGLIDVGAAIAAPVPFDATQTWPASLGIGSLDLARGSDGVVVDGVEVAGELTVTGSPWEGPTAAGARWGAGTWDDERFTGAAWRGAAWRDATWTGARWTGAAWRGAAWRSAAWSASGWNGAWWTSASWTGAAWRDASWTGAAWRDASWTGAAWRGNGWTGGGWE